MARGDFDGKRLRKDSIMHQSSWRVAEEHSGILVGADQSRGWVAITALRTAIRAVVSAVRHYCSATVVKGCHLSALRLVDE